MTYPLYLRTLSSIITVPLWAYPPHYTRALASGEIPATSRLRVCVGLLSVESVRGFPSPRLTFDAAFRVPLSAGCTVDGYCKLPHLAALARSCAVALGIVSFLDPVFFRSLGPGSAWLNWFHLTTVHAWLHLRYPWVARLVDHPRQARGVPTLS